MKIKSVDLILKDYEQQRLSNEEEYSTYYSIHKHFFPSDSDEYNNVYTVDVANKTGQTSFNALVEFIASTMFPDDGSWINFSLTSSRPSPQELQLKHEIEKDMSKKIDQSNFYGEVVKNVADGIAFQKAFMDAQYSHGIHFVPSMGKDLVCSKARGPVARAYALGVVTAAELIETFEGLPVHIAEASDAHDLNKGYQLLVALLPNSNIFFSETQQSDNKFVKVYILVGEQTQIHPKNGVKLPGYKSWPILEYRPYTKSSLCEESLVYCLYADYYQKMDRDQAELVVYPSMAVDERNIREGTANFRSGGTVPVNQGSVLPQAIQTLTGGDVANTQKILSLESKIRHIFKVDIIEGLLTQGLNVFEYHSFRAKVLKAIKPLIGSLNKSYISGLLSRVHNLCMEYDKDYGKKYKGLNGEFSPSNLDDIIAKSEYVSKLGQIVQISAGGIQHMPGLGGAFSDTQLGVLLAEALNVQGALKSPEEIEEEQEAAAQQEQQAQAQETDTAASEAELNRAKAEEAQKGEG